MFDKKIFCAFFVFVFLCCWINPALGKPAGQRASLALLPLEQIAEKDISPLRRGLKNMLISRLAKRAEIKIISICLTCPLPSDKAALARRIQEYMKEYDTNYLLAGRLREGKDHFTVEAMIYARGAEEPVQTFSEEFANDDMIGAVDKITWDIAEKIFGSQKPAPRPKSMTRTVQQPEPMPEALDTSFKSAHPDRILKKADIMADLPELPPIKPYKSFALPAPAKSAEPPVLVEEKSLPEPEAVKTAEEEIPVPAPQIGSDDLLAKETADMTRTRTSETIDMAMQSMDIGDIDGDGRVDVVISENNQLAAYHLEGAELREFARQARKADGRIISVRLADINHNGREEIYVTCVVKNRAESFAVEWSGEKFSYIFKDEEWFVRPLDIPGLGTVLAGQQSGKNKLFAPGVFQLRVISRIIQQGDEIKTCGLNLYNFSLADLDGNGENEIIAIEDDHTLTVKNESGVLWQSSETYGDTIILTLDNDKLIEIPARIMIADINNDKLPDVIVKRNIAADESITDEPDDFLRGSVQAFSWQDGALNKIWQSEEVEGYISGYRFFPAGASHPAQLYAGVVPQSGLLDFFSGQDSLILIYPVVFADHAGQP